MSLGIIDFVKKAWTLTMTVIDDDTNRWENQMAALTEFLKRYSWTPNTNIKKGAVIYCPFGLNERLIAQNDGITGSIEPTWASYKEQGQITDGTVVWSIEAPYVRQALNVAIGTIIQQPWTSAPPGFVALYNGPILQRATYPTLWNFVSTYCSVVSETEWQRRAALNESVGVFSLGDGSTTFRCPKMLSFVRGGTPQNSGEYHADQNKQHNHPIQTISTSKELVGYFRSRSNTYYGNGPSSTLGWSPASGIVSAVEGSLRSEGNADSNRTEYIAKIDATHTHEMSLGNNGGDEAFPKHIVWPYYLCVDNIEV